MELYDAVAILLSNDSGEWLIVTRSIHDTAPGEAGWPGGGVDIGESQEEAVVREAREELGISVAPVSRLGAVELEEHGVLLHLWHCTQSDPSEELSPDPLETGSHEWMPRERIGADPSFTWLRSTHLSLPFMPDL